MRFKICVVLLAITWSTNVSASLLEHVPLQWRPTSELRLGAAQMTQSLIQFGTFQDVRQNREAIGENQEDEKPKPVTTMDDVGAFVRQHMRELFERAVSRP